MTEKIQMTENMIERLLDFEVTEHGTVTEEIELICCMTGFRRRFLVHYLGEGFYRSAELEAS
jgi:hypothetical protein